MEKPEKFLHLFVGWRRGSELRFDALHVREDGTGLLGLAGELNQSVVNMEPHGRGFLQGLVERPEAEIQ